MPENPITLYDIRLDEKRPATQDDFNAHAKAVASMHRKLMRLQQVLVDHGIPYPDDEDAPREVLSEVESWRPFLVIEHVKTGYQLRAIAGGVQRAVMTGVSVGERITGRTMAHWLRMLSIGFEAIADAEDRRSSEPAEEDEA